MSFRFNGQVGHFVLVNNFWKHQVLKNDDMKHARHENADFFATLSMI